MGPGLPAVRVPSEPRCPWGQSRLRGEWWHLGRPIAAGLMHTTTEQRPLGRAGLLWAAAAPGGFWRRRRMMVAKRKMLCGARAVLARCCPARRADVSAGHEGTTRRCRARDPLSLPTERGLRSQIPSSNPAPLPRQAAARARPGGSLQTGSPPPRPPWKCPRELCQRPCL